MFETVMLQLDAPIHDIGVIGAEPDAGDPNALTENQVAQIKAQFEQQTQALRQRLASQQADLDQTTQALQSAGRELATLREQMIHEMRNEALGLAMDIAHKALCQEIQSQGYQMEPIVEQALSRVPRRGEITVRLNPDDFERSGLNNDDAAGNEMIRFVADPNIPPAGCTVQSAEGHVEATPENALQQIHETLKEKE